MLPTPTLFALAAIALWSSLAVLGTLLQHVPPFLLTGIALLVGSVPAWPFFRQWWVSWPALALGVYGLFGFHFFLFIALRHAPAVEANLVNYLWPLGIVLMAPLFLPGIKLSATHLIAGCVGFLGAAIAILGDTLLASGLSRCGWQVLCLGLYSSGSLGVYLGQLLIDGKAYDVSGARLSDGGDWFVWAGVRRAVIVVPCVPRSSSRIERPRLGAYRADGCRPAGRGIFLVGCGA